MVHSGLASLSLVASLLAACNARFEDVSMASGGDGGTRASLVQWDPDGGAILQLNAIIREAHSGVEFHSFRTELAGVIISPESPESPPVVLGRPGRCEVPSSRDTGRQLVADADCILADPLYAAEELRLRSAPGSDPGALDLKPIWTQQWAAQATTASIVMAQRPNDGELVAQPGQVLHNMRIASPSPDSRTAAALGTRSATTVLLRVWVRRTPGALRNPFHWFFDALALNVNGIPIAAPPLRASWDPDAWTKLTESGQLGYVGHRDAEPAVAPGGSTGDDELLMHPVAGRFAWPSNVSWQGRAAATATAAWARIEDLRRGNATHRPFAPPVAWEWLRRFPDGCSSVRAAEFDGANPRTVTLDGVSSLDIIAGPRGAELCGLGWQSCTRPNTSLWTVVTDWDELRFPLMPYAPAVSSLLVGMSWEGATTHMRLPPLIFASGSGQLVNGSFNAYGVFLSVVILVPTLVLVGVALGCYLLPCCWYAKRVNVGEASPAPEPAQRPRGYLHVVRPMQSAGGASAAMSRLGELTTTRSVPDALRRSQRPPESKAGTGATAATPVASERSPPGVQAPAARSSEMQPSTSSGDAVHELKLVRQDPGKARRAASRQAWAQKSASAAEQAGGAVAKKRGDLIRAQVAKGDELYSSSLSRPALPSDASSRREPEPGSSTWLQLTEFDL
ncbi:unnamed protein product [Symbiodinium sp. KB8]|nr:unnamed protein product [Symbiodinium sp. KB8]